MITCSALLINFNKYLLQAERFPFPLHLVLMHTAFASCFGFLLKLVCPSLFPALTDPGSSMQVDSKLICGAAIPIAVANAANILCGNMAYLYCSVAFLQMMKEGNVVLVYLGSLIAGLEVFRSQSVGVLLFITFATLMNVRGELNFSFTGTFIQGTSQFFEVVRIVLQATILSGTGRKLDPLSYVLIVMPLCFLTLASGMGVHKLVSLVAEGVPPIPQPTWQDAATVWQLLLANAFLAFTLNVSIAMFMKRSSAISLVLAGLVKDMLVVFISVYFLKEVISSVQECGFVLQLLGVFLWSLLKAFPENFEQGIVPGLHALAFGSSPHASPKCTSLA